MEKLYTSYGLKANERSYREKFSSAYKVLYRQNGGQEALCYLTEILDSAQENFPHLWVNGEKYVFSDDVIQAGEKLFQEFSKLKELVTDFMDNCTKTGNPRFSEKENELKESLRNFDVAWITYEQYYVYELMVIETDSRRFIINSIKIENELQRFEAKSNLRGEDLINNPTYNAKREELISQLS